MVQFIFFLQTTQNGNRCFHARLIDQDFLEAAFQRCIFFDVFAILIQRGRAYTVQLATCQRWLEHIARIHGTFRFTRADHGVNFINKHNGLAFVLRQLLEHRLQAFFKFATVFGTGQQRGHIQAQHFLVFERIRHFAIHNPLCQAFHNRGFTHTRLTNQHRVVFGAALQYLDRAADFIVTANHWVELAGTCTLSQIQRVFFQGFTLALGVLAVD